MSIQIDKIGKTDIIGDIDLYRVHEIMVSGEIPADQKVQFLKKNYSKISNLADKKISSNEFRKIMNDRPLEIYSPIKNSYTKAGDKKLLAIALGIPTKDVDKYVKNLSSHVHLMHDLKSIGVPKSKYDEVKIYVFRHGTKEQVIDYLDYELAHAKNILKMLYHILRYKSGGVADYFFRPAHKFDNLTLLKVYNTIDKNLQLNKLAGKINDVQAQETAELVLARIYEIQNNQKIKNAIKLKHELESSIL